MALDYDDLRKRLSTMTRQQMLYKIVKAEMVKRGHWKNKPRGRVVPENLHK